MTSILTMRDPCGYSHSFACIKVEMDVLAGEMGTSIIATTTMRMMGQFLHPNSQQQRGQRIMPIKWSIDGCGVVVMNYQVARVHNTSHLSLTDDWNRRDLRISEEYSNSCLMRTVVVVAHAHHLKFSHPWLGIRNDFLWSFLLFKRTSLI